MKKLLFIFILIATAMSFLNGVATGVEMLKTATLYNMIMGVMTISLSIEVVFLAYVYYMFYESLG